MPTLDLPCKPGSRYRATVRTFARHALTLDRDGLADALATLDAATITPSAEDYAAAQRTFRETFGRPARPLDRDADKRIIETLQADIAERRATDARATLAARLAALDAEGVA